jgi:pimeloyl-ACP methyl ester carboxylesterase
VNFALLHGGGQGSWVWDETVAALHEQGARALALDAPGCGAKRGRDTSAVSVADIAAELIADIEAAGLSEVVLVGHSQAGTILPLLAEARPELFARLVYVSCCAPLPGQTILEMMGSSNRGENPDEVGWIVPLSADSPVERYRAMFCNDMAEAEADAFLARLGQDMWPRTSIEYRDWDYAHLAAVPSRFILCEQDTSLPPEWQERFAARLHCASIVRIDAGHQAMNTRPRELAELLLAAN